MIFFFPITAMWLLGPTAMLVTSVIVTTGVIVLDRWNPRAPQRHVSAALAGPGTPVDAPAVAPDAARDAQAREHSIQRDAAPSVVVIDNALATGAEKQA